MKRALVIEDQKPIRESVGELLEVAGCETRLIGDGQAALEELLGCPYDLIILDLNIPSMDGVSLAETITSQDGPNAGTPIIVISAYLSPPVTENLQQLNIKHFLEKPFVAEELLGIVKELLETD